MESYATSWEYANFKNILNKVKARTDTETKTAMGIKTPLDTVSITL